MDKGAVLRYAWRGFKRARMEKKTARIDTDAAAQNTVCRALTNASADGTVPNEVDKSPVRICSRYVNSVTDNDTPNTIPTFRTNAFRLPAIPNLSGGTEPIMLELFGDWNIPCPIPKVAI